LFARGVLLATPKVAMDLDLVALSEAVILQADAKVTVGPNPQRKRIEGPRRRSKQDAPAVVGVEGRKTTGAHDEVVSHVDGDEFAGFVFASP
jgi:hypothetical protein